MPQRLPASSLVYAVVALFLFCSAAAPAHAQPVVRGTVVDAATGETLPSATVQVDGTYRGTITNPEGRFSLRVDSLPVTLRVRYISYETTVQTVEQADRPVEIALTPASVQMDEVVVTGDDFAENIMQKVIDRKQTWWDSLQTYRVEAYNRVTVRNDTGIVSIIESQTAAFWDRERGTREVVRAQRKTANLGLDGALPAAQLVTNLYDDNISIGGHELVGVTHPDAVDRYAFTLDSVRVLDGQRVYDIRVEPASRLASAFSGRVAVLDSAYALLEVDLKPGRSFLFPPPIRGFDVRMQQQFSNFGGRFWLPVDFRTQFGLDVAFGPVLRFPTIRVDQVSRLSDYRVNIPLPDTLYASRSTLIQDSTRAASAGVEPLPPNDVGSDGRSVPLSEAEADAYATIDSTQTLGKAFQPSGLLARFVDFSEDDESTSVSIGSGSTSNASSGESDGSGGGFDWDLSVAPEVAYSRVEEAHLGLTPSLDLGHRLSVEGTLAFNTGPSDAWRWAYGGSGRMVLGEKRRTAVDASYRYGIAPRYDSALYPRLVASTYTLGGGDDYLDYLGSERVEVRLLRRMPRRGLLVGIGIREAYVDPVAKTTDFDIFGTRAAFRPNPVVAESHIRSVSASATWSGTGPPLPFSVSKQERVRLRVEHSDADVLGGDADFTQVQADVLFRVPTFFQRRLLANALDVRLMGSTARGTVPVARLGIADGSLAPFAPFGGLRTRHGQPYQGEHVAAAFWEHTFRTVPFELLRLQGLAQRGWTMLLHGGHARTWLSDAQQGAWTLAGQAPPETNGWHHEIGAGLSGILGVFRVDVSKRLDAGGWGVGLSAARIF